MRMGPIDLYKILPKTNCGECGQPSCLAFSTQVVGYGKFNLCGRETGGKSNFN